MCRNEKAAFPGGTRIIKQIDPKILLNTKQSPVLSCKKSTTIKYKQGVDTDVYLVDRASLVPGNIRDITRHKEVERKREKVAEELRDLYENAPCGYHSLDRNGLFTRINATELSWLGYSREELIGKKKFTPIS